MKKLGWFFFKLSATENPSTKVEYPPLTSFSIQCNNWMLGIGFLYGLSVWGDKGKGVYAKSFGLGFDFTLKYSPKLVLLILPIEFSNLTIKLSFVGTVEITTKPFL